MKGIFFIFSTMFITIWNSLQFQTRNLVREVQDFSNDLKEADTAEKIELLAAKHDKFKTQIITVTGKLLGKPYKTANAALTDLHKHFTGLKTEREKIAFAKKLVRHILFELLPDEEEDEVRLLLDLWNTGRNRNLNFM